MQRAHCLDVYCLGRCRWTWRNRRWRPIISHHTTTTAAIDCSFNTANAVSRYSAVDSEENTGTGNRCSRFSERRRCATCAAGLCEMWARIRRRKDLCGALC